MSVFGKIAKAQVSLGGNYLQPGIYLLYVDVLKLVETRKGDDLYIAEFDILESNNPQQPAGSHASWASNLKYDASPGNVKAFLVGLTGVKEDEVDEEGVAASVSSENPYHGFLIRAEGFNIKTQAQKKDFTKFAWETVPPELQAKAEELRAKAGFKK